MTALAVVTEQRGQRVKRAAHSRATDCRCPAQPVANIIAVPVERTITADDHRARPLLRCYSATVSLEDG